VIFSRHFVTTNGLGAEEVFAVGQVVLHFDEWWKVTKLKRAHDGWGGIKVYGRKVKPR
jgi:hypothetical protein